MEHANQNLPRLITMAEVCEITSLSRAMVNKLRAGGRFPLAVPLTEGRIVFVRAEVDKFLDERIAARTAA